MQKHQDICIFDAFRHFYHLKNLISKYLKKIKPGFVLKISSKSNVTMSLKLTGIQNTKIMNIRSFRSRDAFQGCNSWLENLLCLSTTLVVHFLWIVFWFLFYIILRRAIFLRSIKIVILCDSVLVKVRLNLQILQLTQHLPDPAKSYYIIPRHWISFLFITGLVHLYTLMVVWSSLLMLNLFLNFWNAKPGTTHLPCVGSSYRILEKYRFVLKKTMLYSFAIYVFHNSV